MASLWTGRAILTDQKGPSRSLGSVEYTEAQVKDVEEKRVEGGKALGTRELGTDTSRQRPYASCFGTWSTAGDVYTMSFTLCLLLFHLKELK